MWSGGFAAGFPKGFAGGTHTPTSRNCYVLLSSWPHG